MNKYTPQLESELEVDEVHEESLREEERVREEIVNGYERDTYDLAE